MSTIGLPANAERLAEILRDYDDTLELRWIPPENRTGFDDKPFAVWQNHPDYPPYLVMAVGEKELDERVLAAIFNANTSRTDVLARLEREDAAREVWKQKEILDRQEEAADLAKWALKNVGHDRYHKGLKYT